MRALWMALALTCQLACSPTIPEGIFACAADSDCPDGLSCGADQLCRRLGNTGGGDGGTENNGGGNDANNGGDSPGGSNAPDASGINDDAGAGDGGGSHVGADGGAPVDGNGSPQDAGADGGGTNGNDAGDNDAGATCPSSHVCVPPVPLGWNGPVALGEGDSRPACSGAYPDSLATGGSGVQAQAANCNCGCGDPSGVQCNSTVRLTYYSSSSCLPDFGGNQSQNFVSGTCSSANPPGGTDAVRVSGSTMEGSGSCEETEDHSFPAASWQTEMRVCGGVTLARGCSGDQLCAPLPPAALGNTVCIWREAQAACPAGYTALNSYHATLEEGRSCSACSCGSPTGATCNVRATLYGGGCPEPGTIITVPPPVVETGECQTVGSISNVSSSTLGTSGGQCSSSGGSPQGSVTAADPITVCCI